MANKSVRGTGMGIRRDPLHPARAHTPAAPDAFSPLSSPFPHAPHHRTPALGPLRVRVRGRPRFAAHRNPRAQSGFQRCGSEASGVVSFCFHTRCGSVSFLFPKITIVATTSTGSPGCLFQIIPQPQKMPQGKSIPIPRHNKALTKGTSPRTVQQPFCISRTRGRVPSARNGRNAQSAGRTDEPLGHLPKFAPHPSKPQHAPNGTPSHPVRARPSRTSSHALTPKDSPPPRRARLPDAPTANVPLCPGSLLMRDPIRCPIRPPTRSGFGK